MKNSRHGRKHKRSELWRAATVMRRMKRMIKKCTFQRQVSLPIVACTYFPANATPQVPETTPLPTLDGAIARLRDMRVDGERAHSEKQKLSELSQKELVDLSQSESETRQQVEEVETRRSFFDDLRTWADDIASFLDDKEPELNKIEKRHDEIITERSSILSKRREGGEMAITLAPSEEGDYAKAKESIKGDVKRLFEDVKAATFLDPSQVLNEKFSEWRKAFGDEYLRAWAPLGMVSVWEFWTKVEMTGWDALRVGQCRCVLLQLTQIQGFK